MPLRVALIQPSLPKYRVPVFRELANRPGIDLHVYYGTVPGLPNAQPDGFAATPARTRILNIPFGGAEIHSPPPGVISRNSCDVAVFGWNLRFLNVPLALVKARLLRIPTVVWGHGYSKHERPFKQKLRIAMVRLADTAVLYNYTVGDELVRAGLPRQRVFVAQNTVDQTPIQAARERWLADPARLDDFRRRHNLTAGPNLLFVSRLTGHNGTDKLIEAAALLRPRHPGLRVIIVGDGVERPDLERLITARNLQDCVTLTGAIYNEDDLAPWFLTSHAFVYPENIGLSLIHAQSYGLPAITSDRIEAQNPEIEALVPEDNGLLYRHGSIPDLAAVIERLWTDQPLRARLAESAAVNARHRYTVPRMVDGLEAAIRMAAMRYSHVRGHLVNA